MIQNEIDRITEGKADLRTAIIAKGVDIPSSTLIDNYALAIHDIDLGGEMTEEVRKIVNRTATSIVVPSTVQYLRPASFYNCTLLQEIVMLPTTPPTRGLDSLEGTNNCVIYVPDESLTDYQNTWTDLATRIQALSGRTMTYDFGNASEDSEAIPTYENKTREIRYETQRLTTWMTTEYDGLYLTGSAYDNLYWMKRNRVATNTIIGLYNKAPSKRAFSIDTKGYNTITLTNGYPSTWSASTFSYIDGGTITVADDGKSATITVNQGVTKVDVMVKQMTTITTMVFTM